MIVECHDLSALRHDLKDASIALRFGTYDLLHAGHREGINFAATQADVLAIGIMPDSYVRRVKGPERPLRSQLQRVQSMDNAESVDYSFIAPASKLGAASILMALRPDVYVEGAEHVSAMKRGFLAALGINYIVHNGDRSQSSSRMLAQLGRDGALARSSFTFNFGRTE